MNINLVGVINKLSYGIVTRNIIKALINNDESVALFPIGERHEFEPDEIEILKNAVGFAQYFDVNAPCIRIWHQFDMSQFVGKSKHIGYPIFELNRFKDLDKHHLNSCDELFVCSNWAKSICEKELRNDIKISVVPLGVDTSVFNPKNNRSSDSFIIHNIGKIEIRKGHDIIPEILKLAFKKDDNFRLKMMWRNPVVDRQMGLEKITEWENFYSTELWNRVDFLSPVEFNNQVAEFLNSSHLGLYPARAEGWNLSLLESMACGCHVVTTNYSAHTEYCNDKNSALVTPKSLESAFDSVFFDGFGEWAHISDSDIKEMALLVRYYYDKWKRGWNQNEFGIETANKFTWSNTARTIKEQL